MPEETFTDVERELRSKLTEPVFIAVGAASACWENLSGAGVFESDRAKSIAEELLDRIVDAVEQVSA